MDRIFRTPQWLSLGLATLITFGTVQALDHLSNSQAATPASAAQWAARQPAPAPVLPARAGTADEARRPAA